MRRSSFLLMGILSLVMWGWPVLLEAKVPTMTTVFAQLSDGERLLEGEQKVRIEIHSGIEGNAIWSEDQIVFFKNGRFSSTIGLASENPLTSEVLATENPYTAISVDGIEGQVFIPIRSLPFAYQAIIADQTSDGFGLNEGTPDVENIVKFNGQTWVSVPEDIGTYGGIVFSNASPAIGDVLKWDEVEWVPSSDILELPGLLAGSGAANQGVIWQDEQTLAGNSLFVWDQALNRLGLGTSLPSETLEVSGSGIILGSFTGAQFNGDGSGLLDISAEKVSSGAISGVPLPNQILKWNGSEWTPSGDSEVDFFVDLFSISASVGDVLKFDGNEWGATSDSIGVGGPVSGTGGINQISYWTSSDAIAGDSSMLWDAANQRLSVGTSNAEVALTVEGGVAVDGVMSAENFIGIASTSDAILTVLGYPVDQTLSPVDGKVLKFDGEKWKSQSDTIQPGAIREQFYSGFSQQDFLLFKAQEVVDNSSGYFSFQVPFDIDSFSEMVLVGIYDVAATANPSGTIDLDSNCGGDGELATAHTGNVDGLFPNWTGIPKEIIEVDVSSAFSFIQSGDYCGVKVSFNGIGGDFFLLGLRLKYAATDLAFIP